jgi:hypothetical protein
VLLGIILLVLNGLHICGLLKKMPWNHEGQNNETKNEETPNKHGWKADFPRNLDVGIYWFGMENDPGPQFEPPALDADSATVKTALNAHPHFDPTRPSVLFVHGYLRGSTSRGYRPTFNWSKNFAGSDLDAADDFIKAGYNIGVFYWTQLCDDDTPHHAEVKIFEKPKRWLARDEKAGQMRYHYASKEGEKEGNGMRASVGEQLAGLLRRTFRRGGSSGDYRLVGHSLGAQLAVRAASLLLQHEDCVLPSRISLCDAFLSNGKKRFLSGSTPAQVIASGVEALRNKGCFFEAFEVR